MGFSSASRLKREDCKRTKHDSVFSQWEILIGPLDWENHSLGMDGVVKYRIHNIPLTSSCPGRNFRKGLPYRGTTMSAAASTFNGNLKKALAGIRRINLEGLRWRVFDAKGQVLGRLASQISTVLQGKCKPTYTPYREDGDMCIVLNAKDICVTGRKLTDKFYRWHTGYIGHLKERSLKDQMAKDPTEVIRKAVLRMLPRNKLRDDRDRKLRIFVGGEHPFSDRPVEPYMMPPRAVRELRPRARRAMIRAQKKAETQQQKGGSGKMERRNREINTEISA